MILVWIFVLVYCALGVIALRRPLLARLALREALRRPWQSALVVAGLTVGTSMILMSLINSDSMTTSLTQATYQSWGRVDILVSNNGAFFGQDVASGLARSPQLQGKVRGIQGGVELVGTAADLDRRLDNPTVRLIGFDPAAQLPFGSFTLADGHATTGSDLGTDSVLVSQSLADSLQAQMGDTLQVAANAYAPVDFKVGGIARPTGPGDYGAQPAIFAPVATLATLTGTDRINVVRISARGDGQEELDNGKGIAPAVVAALSSVPAGGLLHVQTAKADDVNEIIKLAAQNGPTTLALSMIIVLAGIALVVNLALALAEERRPQLAVLRALGLSRAGLVLTTVVEGAFYSLGAALIGAIPGIAAGWFLVSQAGRWVPEIHEKSATVLFVVSTQSIAISIAAGALITLVTLLAASVRTSRLAIASAVRALPDPPVAKRSGRQLMGGALALGVAGSVAAIIGGPALRLFGGLTVIGMIGLLLRGRLPGRAWTTLTGLAAIVWLLGTYSSISQILLLTDVWVTVGALAILIAALSVVVAVNVRLVERIVSRSLVAQLTRRPAKLTLAAGSIGLVLSLLAYIGVFLASTIPHYPRDADGYDVAIAAMGSPIIALPPALESKVDGRMTVATSGYLGAARSSSSERGPGPLDWHQQLIVLYQLTDDQLAQGALHLGSREPRYGSDRAVWAAVRNDPRLVVSGMFNPGTTVDMVGSNGYVELTVVGSFKPGFFAGLMGSTAALGPLSSSALGTTELVRLKPGVDPAAFALDVRRSLFPSGVQATTTRDLLDRGVMTLTNFGTEIELLLTAGLAVGVLSLGVLALRAVVERRRTIGLLRAVGFQPRQLLVAVIGESLLTAGAGVIVGVVGGLVMGYLLIIQLYPGGQVSIQAGNLLVAVALIFFTAAAVTIVPAMAVARIAPAEALRLVD